MIVTLSTRVGITLIDIEAILASPFQLQTLASRAVKAVMFFVVSKVCLDQLAIGLFKLSLMTSFPWPESLSA